MTNSFKSTIRGILSVALLVSANIVQADIHDRIEYKLNRILRDVEIINDGNIANCRPINQELIDRGSGVFTITQSGLWCVTQDVVGTIIIDSNSVCLDLECHVVDGGGNASAIISDGNDGVRISNGTVANTTSAGILVNNCESVELSYLYFTAHDNYAVRVTNSDELFIHNLNFAGALGGNGALSIATSSNFLVQNCQMIGYATSTATSILSVDTSSRGFVQDTNVTSNAFSTSSGAGIEVSNSTDITVEHTNVYDTTTTVTTIQGHGILVDTCRDCKLIRSQVHGNQNSGVELVGSNTAIAIIECVALENDIGFDFAASSTASCCLVQDNRAISNRTSGFVYSLSPLTTSFVGNLAQCNGSTLGDNYVIDGPDLISLQELSWVDGNFTIISGNAALGSRFTNIVGSNA